MPRKSKPATADKRLSVTLYGPTLDGIAKAMRERPELRTISDVLNWAVRVATAKGGES